MGGARRALKAAGPETEPDSSRLTRPAPALAPAGEFNFFNTTLSLRSQLSYRTVFAEAGLQPGDSVSVKDLTSAAQSAVGAKVAFGCQNDGLQTVSTCLSKDLRPIDCPSYVYSGNYGNCDPSSTIEWRSAEDTRANADAAVAVA